MKWELEENAVDVGTVSADDRIIEVNAYSYLHKVF